LGSTKNVRPKFMLRRAELANICAIILRWSTESWKQQERPRDVIMKKSRDEVTGTLEVGS